MDAISPRSIAIDRRSVRARARESVSEAFSE